MSALVSALTSPLHSLSADAARDIFSSPGVLGPVVLEISIGIEISFQLLLEMGSLVSSKQINIDSTSFAA